MSLIKKQQHCLEQWVERVTSGKIVSKKTWNNSLQHRYTGQPATTHYNNATLSQPATTQYNTVTLSQPATTQYNTVTLSQPERNTTAPMHRHTARERETVVVCPNVYSVL